MLAALIHRLRYGWRASRSLGEGWWTLPGSNRSPLPCHGSALPDELRAQTCAYHAKKASERQDGLWRRRQRAISCVSRLTVYARCSASSECPSCACKDFQTRSRSRFATWTRGAYTSVHLGEYIGCERCRNIVRGRLASRRCRTIQNPLPSPKLKPLARAHVPRATNSKNKICARSNSFVPCFGTLLLPRLPFTHERLRSNRLYLPML
jgi:hypothetical protein